MHTHNTCLKCTTPGIPRHANGHRQPITTLLTYFKTPKGDDLPHILFFSSYCPVTHAHASSAGPSPAKMDPPSTANVEEIVQNNERIVGPYCQVWHRPKMSVFTICHEVGPVYRQDTLGLTKQQHQRHGWFAKH